MSWTTPWIQRFANFAGMLLLATTANAAEPIFQGLPWGATEAQIETRFAGQTKRRICDSALKQFADKLEQVCEGLYVEPYEVEGMPFKLSFNFSKKTRLLDNVSLDYSTEAPNVRPSSTPDARWNDTFLKLKDTLTDRYGPPVSSYLGGERGSKMGSAEWRTGATIVRLQSLFWGSTSFEQHSILYYSNMSGSAGKL
ncbi:hypothetical protein GCM10027399_09080 [Curvibacter fontanus]